MINTYRTWIDDAYAEADRDESIGKWQRLFGDDFAKGEVLQKAATVSEQARANLSRSTALTSPGFVDDLVTLFARFGRRILPANFDRLPYKQRPRWPTLPAPLFKVEVAATHHSSKHGRWIDSVASGAGPLPKENWLKFDARTGLGTPISSDYRVFWRVTNTDQEAMRANQLRGGFERPNDGASRWERLAYRGVHMVEAFLVRKRDDVLVAHSEPFYVVIQ
jgi:hypothetical protein